MLGILPLLLAASAAALPMNLTGLWHGDAWQAVIADDLVIALEADLRHVVALDAASGKVRWRTEAQAKPNGFHTLSLQGRRLFLWAGPTLIELALADGRKKARGEILHNRRECVLMVTGDQGAASCDIGLWLFGLAPIELGPLMRATEIHLYDRGLGQPHSTHFASSARTLLGTAGGLAIVAIEDDQDTSSGHFARKAVLAGVDPKTGDVRWRTRALVEDGLTSAGLVADGSVAWVLSETTRVAGGVRTRDGATGWRLEAAGDTPFNGDVLDDAMIVLAGDRLTCLSFSGQRHWQHPAEGAARVVAFGGREAPLVYPGDRPMKVALATRAGAIVIVEVPPYGQILRDGDGLVLASPGHLRTYDPRGIVTAETAGPEGGTWALAPAAIGGFSGGKTMIVRRRDGEPIAGLPEGAQLVGGRGDVIALMTPSARTDAPGELSLVRLDR